MIQGELEVLKDWCYEAVREPAVPVEPRHDSGSWTEPEPLSEMILNLLIISFFFYSDLQSVGASNPAGQSHGTSVQLQDPGHRQRRCEDEMK